MPRYSLRPLMIVVTVVAVDCGVWQVMKRQEEFRIKARLHSVMPSFGRFKSPPITQAQKQYHENMAEKYARAARYPWLPVEADPPLPEDKPATH